MDFAVCDVLRLFKNCKILSLLEIEYQDYLDTRDDDISCSRMEFSDLKGVGIVYIRVEDQAINRIEVQQDYISRLDKLRQDEALLHAALDTLTDREREVVILAYNSQALSQLTTRYSNELLESGMNKLCRYVSKARADRLEVFKADYIQDKQRRLFDYKRTP